MVGCGYCRSVALPQCQQTRISLTLRFSRGLLLIFSICSPRHTPIQSGHARLQAQGATRAGDSAFPGHGSPALYNMRVPLMSFPKIPAQRSHSQTNKASFSCRARPLFPIGQCPNVSCCGQATRSAPRAPWLRQRQAATRRTEASRVCKGAMPYGLAGRCAAAMPPGTGRRSPAHGTDARTTVHGRG